MRKQHTPKKGTVRARKRLEERIRALEGEVREIRRQERPDLTREQRERESEARTRETRESLAYEARAKEVRALLDEHDGEHRIDERIASFTSSHEELSEDLHTELLKEEPSKTKLQLLHVKLEKIREATQVLFSLKDKRAFVRRLMDRKLESLSRKEAGDLFGVHDRSITEWLRKKELHKAPDKRVSNDSALLARVLKHLRSRPTVQGFDC